MLYNRSRSSAQPVINFNHNAISTPQAPWPPPPPPPQTHNNNHTLLLNMEETKELSNNKYIKQGWLNQRKRYFKKWKKRYVRIEQHQYICTYQSDNDDLINCVNTIDLTESKIKYSLDKPEQFTIYNNGTEFHFQCTNVSETNEWLTILKQISVRNRASTVTNSDLDLVTMKSISSRRAIYNKNEAKISASNKVNTSDKKLDIMITDMEINDIYMKAVSLYQHKHYQECERVTKSVLTINPNHKQAAQLYKYLVDKKYNQFNNEQNNSYKKIKRIKFGTIGNYNKLKQNNSVKKRKWKRFNRKNTVFNGNKIGIQNIKKEEQKEISHRCQIEFDKFLKERVQISKYYKNLNDKFVSVKYNDIRFMKDFDKHLLENEIGLRPLHCSLFMRKIRIFMNENILFKEWLNQIVIKQKRNDKFNDITSDGIIDLFENNGIMTFEQLHRYIKTKMDLEIIMRCGNDCDSLWIEIENIYKIEIEKKRKGTEGVYDSIDELGNIEKEGNNEGLIVDTGDI